MSIEIRATIVCDGCGARINGPVAIRATSGMCSYWDAKAQAEKLHWLTLPRYGRHRHLCAPCADGQPIPQATPGPFSAAAILTDP